VTEPTPDPVAFVRQQIVLADGRRVGAALDDDQWIEEDVLAPVFERDAASLPRFRLVYLELPRGHWKSGGAAAIALTEAVLFPDTDVVVAAADTDQARIVIENLDGYLSRNAGLGRRFKRKRDEFSVRENRSRIRVISSDAPTAWGLGGTHRRFRLICDELTVWKSEDLWLALASATGKTPDVQTIVISNAGYSQSGWQWRVRESAGESDWGYLLSVDGVLASWITDEWIEQMRTLLPGPAFDRVIGNRWTSESGDFVSREQWRRCVDLGLAERSWTPAHGTVFVGLDLGLTHDRTALAAVYLDKQTVVLDELQVWQGSREEPVEIASVERALVDLRRRHPRLRVLADPWQLKSSIQRLSAAGVSIEEHAFAPSAIAKLSSLLYEVISGATLRVFDDQQLEEEMLGLQVVQSPSGWRFDHRAQGYSDRAVALAMATRAAIRYRPSLGKPRPLPEPDYAIVNPAVTF
jgi:hypothetical protein